MSQNQRKQMFANDMHKTIFTLVLISAIVPMVIVTVALFFLAFEITADEIGMPEIIQYHVLPAAKKVITIIFIAAPIIIAAILFFVHRITHRIIGPFDRIVRELGECVSGSRKGPIVLRDGDKFRPMVDGINALLDKQGQ